MTVAELGWLLNINANVARCSRAMAGWSVTYGTAEEQLLISLDPRRSALPRARRLLKTSCRIGVRPDSVQVPGETLSYGGCPPASLGWLSSGLRPRRAPREERLERGFVLLEVAVPCLPN
jgi:hypothetical protein